MPPKGKSASGRYRFLGEGRATSILGSGSYGYVCPAWDTQEEQLVAINVQKRDSETAMREMLFFEVITRHPNVLHMRGMFVTETKLNLVFEYCTHSLRDIFEPAQAVSTGAPHGVMATRS